MEQIYSPGLQGSVSLFIGGLSKETSLREIIEYVEKFSPVLNIHMPVHKVTGQPVGYAFVRLGDPQAAARLVAQANHIGNRTVDVQYAIEKEKKEDYKLDLLKRKIFIAGIKHFVKFEHIKAALETHGSLKLFYRIETSHRNRGLAFAEFQESGAAESVVAQGLFVDGCQLRVSYFRPKPEDDSEYSNQVKKSYHPMMDNDAEDSHLSESSNLRNLNSQGNMVSGQTQKANNSQQMREELADIQDSSKTEHSNYTFRILLGKNPEDSYKKISLNGTTLYIKSGTRKVSMKRHRDNPASKTTTARRQPVSSKTSHNLRAQKEGLASSSFNSPQQAPLTKTKKTN